MVPSLSWASAESSLLETFKCMTPALGTGQGKSGHPICSLGYFWMEPGLGIWDTHTTNRNGASETQLTWLLTLIAPNRVSWTVVKNHFTALDFLPQGKCWNLRKKCPDNPGTWILSLFAYLSSVPFMLKCQQNWFTAGPSPWPICPGYERHFST